MKKKTLPQEIAIKNEPQNQAYALISQAIDKGASVETMERLFALYKEMDAARAKKEYDEAMSALQAELPIIQKTKAGGSTKSGVVAYYYAPLDAIVAQTKDLISKNNFSYLIKTEMHEKGVKIFCKITHISGHSETSDVDMPLSTKTDIMSAPQVVAATITFGKRYAFCNAFGILTGDEDNDASPKIIKKEPTKLTKEEYFNQLKKSIEISKNTDFLIATSEKIKEGKFYSEKQKTELHNLINEKIDVLNN